MQDINKEHLNECVLKRSCTNIYIIWRFSKYKTKFSNLEVHIICPFLYAMWKCMMCLCNTQL
jgi:hypothetical protein